MSGRTRKVESQLKEIVGEEVLLDANLEAGRGAKAAIVGEYGEVSYERLLAMACAAGRALKALGVQREQRVLMVMDDTPAFPAVFLGAIRAGMVPVPLNPLFKADDYRYLLADSDAQAVIVDLELLDKVRDALAAHPERVELIVVGGATEGAHAFARSSSAGSWTWRRRTSRCTSAASRPRP